MRTVNLSFTETAVTYPQNRSLGKMYEHNATRLAITLPSYMLTDADHFRIVFGRNKSVFLSERIVSGDGGYTYVSVGGILYYTLSIDLTQSSDIAFTVKAYNSDDSFITESPLFDGFFFEEAVCENGAVDGFCSSGVDAEIFALQSDIEDINEALSSKVNVEQGKGLSSNDFTSAEKTKLSLIESCAEVNVIETVKLNGEALPVLEKTVDIRGISDSNYVHTDNNFTTPEKMKLAGVEEGAEVNIIRAINVNGSSVSVTNGTANITAVRDDSYVHTDCNYTGTEKTKLASVAPGAEVNVINAITLNGETVAVTNKTAAISAVVDNSYVHTDNNFTTAEKTKLAAIDVKYSVQHYADLSSLPQTAGTRATVQSDGNQLTFGTFDLQLNADLASPAIFPIPNMSNIGAVYDYASGGSGRSVSVGFTVDGADGTPLILVYVSVNGVTYLGISRDATIGSTALTKGWYNVSDSTPVQRPTLDDFEIVRFSLGGTTYTSGDTLPTDRIKLLSRFINISQNDMRGAGDYVYSGSAWEYVPKEDELIYYTGTLEANKKYFCKIGQDMSVTLPETVDATRDNSILLYLECSADVDLSFPNGTNFYGGVMPDTTAGSHELTFVYNPNTGVWTVGGLNSEAVT